MAIGSYIFFPWVREGLVGAITVQDDAGLKDRVSLNVQVSVNNNTPVGTTTVRLYGPGDVVGFDHRMIIRTEPKHLAQNFETNYFPFVEFDRPDFPWLFTPARANGNHLRPWISLIAVEKDKAKITTDSSRPLPVLHVEAGGGLPDLGESWAWAHSQIIDTGGDRADALTNRPELNLSRLLCPRELSENKSYYACIVPAFESGRRAGLGERIDDQVSSEAPLQPAWTDSAGSIDLPIYYHWEFSTGPTGDFESLVRKLKPRHLDPKKVGKRKMKVPKPTVFYAMLEGALRPVQPDQVEAQDADLIKFRDSLSILLNNPATFSGNSQDFGEMPILPPIYGRWHAANKVLSSDKNICKEWLRELNTDPRHRAVAAFGTKIVQMKQEQLMASAWEQVEDIERVNQALRQAQLARESMNTIYRDQITKFPSGTFLQITSPVHSRIQLPYGGATVYSEIRNSSIPMDILKGAFRRLVRPRGPVIRKLEKATPGKIFDITELLAKLDDSADLLENKILSEDAVPDGMGTTKVDMDADDIRCDMPFCVLVRNHLNSLNPSKLEGEEHHHHILASIKEVLIVNLDPEKSLPKRWRFRIEFPATWAPEDPLEPVMAAPDFPTPMYKPLAELSQDLILPGIEHVLPDTITALETNPGFIRSYMVGLNHEMSSELLWREFPTDQRGTSFRQFWDPSGRFPAPEDPDESKDIDLITNWQKNMELEKKLDSEKSTTDSDKQESSIVLLIRGELLRRYPTAVIYMTRAEWTDVDAEGNPVKPYRKPESLPIDPATEHPEKYPIFRGTLLPDITFFGFSLGVEEAIGNQDRQQNNPGWFFVIQQPPTEPRFGLDATDSSKWACPTCQSVKEYDSPGNCPCGTALKMSSEWENLSWENIETQDGYIYLSRGIKKETFSPPGDDYTRWSPASHSAVLAEEVTLQGPFRIAIHASDLEAQVSEGTDSKKNILVKI
jgi:hypothetical protein